MKAGIPVGCETGDAPVVVSHFTRDRWVRYSKPQKKPNTEFWIRE